VVDFGAALLALGTQVVKSACRLWLGDGFAGDMSDTVADLLQDQVPDAIQRHKLKGMFEGFAGTVADKARHADDSRFRSLPDNEREAAILAVAKTFYNADLNDAALFAVNLDARTLEKCLRMYVEARKPAWGLSEHATSYFDFLLRECCSYLLEITKTLPQFTSQALTELLRRSSAIEQQLAQVLDRLPARTSMSGDEGFETDYRRQVAHELDYMNLFGASVFEGNRGYQLSVAYISLLVTDTGAPEAQQGQGQPVESVLAASSRVFLRGEAGSGKTTLLQWIAVSAARHEFPAELSEWNGLVPFFLRLRQFRDAWALPQPEDFISDGAAAMLAAEMPDMWVRRILRAGRGIVLIDGVDEVPRLWRPLILDWLRRLIATFPQSHFVVTSRPAAVAEDWLAGQGFQACFVQPMTPPDVKRFIAHWHQAMTLTVVENSAKQELQELSRALSEQVFAKRYLRQLATNPLLCALLCALNRDRRAELPTNRIELYRISLEMFLQRRDTERQLTSKSARMGFDDKLHLLQDLAYWMMTNGWAIVERDLVANFVSTRLMGRRHRVTGTADEVLEHLLERSGVIREPVAGWIDFIHRSFQEYLAAQAAVDRDEIEALAGRATDEQWRQVVILATGLGHKRQTERIFERLLNPPRKLREHKLALELTALGCLETAPEVDPVIAEHIKQGAGALIPPRSSEHAYALSRVGEHAYDLLADVRIDDDLSLHHMIRVAAMVGGSPGLKLLENISDGLNPQFDGEAFTDTLVDLWPGFDPIEFADRLLARRDMPVLTVHDDRTIPGLSRLPKTHTLVFQLGPDDADYTFLASLPRLKQVIIPVQRGNQKLLLAFPPSECEVTLQKTAHAFVGAYRSGRTLVLSGLDATRTLLHLTLEGEVDRVVVEEDDRLRSLAGLQLPLSATELEVNNCLRFSSLNGAEKLAGSRLEKLTVEMRLSGSLESAAAPLFQQSLVHDRPLIEELRYLHISTPGISRGAQDDTFIKQLTALGFQIETSRMYHYTITARR
jgi:NACHT domain